MDENAAAAPEEVEAPPSVEAAAEGEPQLTPADLVIQRDPTFTRISADGVHAAFRGYEIELVLMAHGPDPVSQSVLLDQIGSVHTQKQMQLKPSYSDLGRLRMPIPVGINLAMQILTQGLTGGVIDPDGMRRVVDDALERFRAEEADPAANSDDATPADPAA